MAGVSGLRFREAGVEARQVSPAHASFAIRPGSFFVQRMLASVRMPHTTAGADFACRTANAGRRVALGLEFQGNLEVWR